MQMRMKRWTPNSSERNNYNLKGRDREATGQSEEAQAAIRFDMN